ncbi:MAG TPA: crosslink repair DNA glycosylase YcaQ family protein, partial [Candidatus Binataceae bacterium]|nr:crosslink repair DNA glycosylase YcaQ family protein [Candidatus Binataceae bacterium]
MQTIALSRVAARRFILGRQGLWPGRRFKGKRGLELAMRAMEYLQLDPLQVAARSQDIALYGRVVGYRPGQWEQPCYQERKFFDWGGWLAVRPMDELPHWRVVMRRECANPRFLTDQELVAVTPRVRGAPVLRKLRAAIEEMRAAVRANGTVSNRDFAMATRRLTNNYRGRKDSAVALYYLWRTGELMTHHRERFERVYGAAENIAPPHLLCESSELDADAFLMRKTISFHGFHRLSGGGSGDIGNPVLRRVLGRPVTAREVTRLRDRMLSDGEIVAVSIEGFKDLHYALAADAEQLRELAAGRTPRAWQPCDTSTREEVTFVSPLDIVTARERARALFGFDYKWEVYVPLAQRKYGYYALPILWDDCLVARSDLKLDRATNTLVVCGIWFEERKTAVDPAFHDALQKGVARFMQFVGATQLDLRAV